MCLWTAPTRCPGWRRAAPSCSRSRTSPTPSRSRAARWVVCVSSRCVSTVPHTRKQSHVLGLVCVRDTRTVLARSCAMLDDTRTGSTVAPGGRRAPASAYSDWPKPKSQLNKKHPPSLSCSTQQEVQEKTIVHPVSFSIKPRQLLVRARLHPLNTPDACNFNIHG
jgi:hypothetical protein